MEKLNVYYNKEILKRGRKFIAIPILQMDMFIYLNRKKLNIYQEIILELYKCGNGDMDSIEEVLRLNILNEGERKNSEIKGLSEYIVKELEKLNYIKNNNITEEGNRALEENLEDEKNMGSIFFNTVTNKYLNFIYSDSLYKISGKGGEFVKTTISQDCLKKYKNIKINFGTIGEMKEENVIFLKCKNKKSKIDFDIENFVEIIQKEISILHSKIKTERNSDLFNSEKTNFFKEKIDFLNELIKYKIIDEYDSYLLIVIEKDKVFSSIDPDTNDLSLAYELKQYEQFKYIFKDIIEDKYAIDFEKKNEIIEEFTKVQREIIADSNEKLNYLPDLVNKLSILPNDTMETENTLEKEEKFGKVIRIVYESFAEVFLHIYRKYSKTEKLSKKNIKSNLENVLIDYHISDSLINYYISAVNGKHIPYIQINKNLKELFGYILILEKYQEKKILKLYLKNNSNFFEFIKKLVNMRNNFSHSGENQAYIDDLEYDFEAEAKNELIKFIEFVFEFKFKDSLNLKTIDKETENKYRYEVEKLLELEFADCYSSAMNIYHELVESSIYFKYYSDFRNPNYKSTLIKKIGMLLESNLNMLKNRLDKGIVLDSSLKEKKEITLEEINKEFFEKLTIPENEWINRKFEEEEISRIKIYTNKILVASKLFEHGTLNNCTCALLYTKGNMELNRIVEKCPDFFKLVFIISSLRGHAGKFNLKSSNNSKDEVNAVEKLLKTVYETQKKLLKTLEDIDG